MSGKIIYTKELTDKTDKLIPEDVRKALAQFGWNEFGIYEVIKKSIKECKKEKTQAIKKV